jgi:hypothetical protein
MDSTLQSIMDQLSAISAGQEQLKMEISAEKSELRSEISGLSTDLITKISGMEDRIDTRVREVREELETKIEVLCAGQAQWEEKLDRQNKGVTSMVEQQTQALRNDLNRARQELEATRRDLENQLAAVERRTRRAAVGGVTNASTVKPPKFDGLTSWAIFHRQFEAAATHNNWQPGEKAAHLLSGLQGQAADILHSLPTEATYEDIVGALRDRFGDHQLAAAYRSQLKTRVQASGETLQEFAAAVEQLAHRALVGLPVGYIQTEAAHSFIDGVRDREVKQHLLLGGDRSLNEALNQALKLEAAKAAAGQPVRLREVTRAPTGGNESVDTRREGRPVCWQCGSPGHLRRDCRRRPREERNDVSGNE